MKTRPSFSRLLCAALGITSSLAVAAPDALPASTMEMKYDWNTREAPPTQLGGTCPIHVAPTQDDRQNKETIGASFNGALLVGEAGRWVSDGLIHLKNFGFPVDEVDGATAPQDGGVTVKATLTRAYTWQIGLKLFSMVAVKAQFVDKNGVIQEKYYRAHGDKTNMWGADSEYLTTLNYGLNNLLPVLAEDLVSLCKGSKVASYSYAGPTTVPSK